MESPIRLTVLISGNGSNLQAVIDEIHHNNTNENKSSSKLPNTAIVRVLSNRKSAYGLERATKAGIPTTYHNLLKYKKKNADSDSAEGVQQVQAAREEYDAELARLVIADSPDLVACLGFMHVLSTRFLQPLEDKGIRIVNLHPALPGEFNGVDAIERAHTAWQEGKISRTGVMIHNVISEVDMGQPVLVKEIPFVEGADEDLEKFKQKVHGVEWGAVIEGLQIVIGEIRAKRSSS